MADNGQQELEIGAGDKKFKLRGSDLLTSVIGIIVCSGLAVSIYILFDHKTDSKESSKAFVEVVKEMGQTAKEGVIAQREMNCLSIFAIEQREKNQDFCKRMAR